MTPASRPRNDAATTRIGTLSVLPVFLDLEGRRAVVAAASPAAAWKAELLCAAGARVEVFASPHGVSEAMSHLAQRESALMLRDRPWRPEDLAGAAIAVADAADDDEAVAFAAAASAAGTPCNVIDRPRHCHFQFGTIVNRSPVVVGISTSGAAPILAQAVRRRIETLLPPSLAAWAALARRWREGIAARLRPGPARRAFWESFIDLAFAASPDVDTLADLLRTVGASPRRGHVSFVGAGPGEAELLTLKAVRALQAADVILFDDLVSNEILELARREAQRIPVGQRIGQPSCRQHEISDMMVALARADRRVVRLKIGDPMISGSARDETAVLEREGIDYDIVPGITAQIAGKRRAGCSRTSALALSHAMSP